MVFLDCFRQTDQGQAHINVKIGCCNKKVMKKRLSKHNSTILMSLFEMTDDKFNLFLKIIQEEYYKTHVKIEDTNTNTDTPRNKDVYLVPTVTPNK